MKSKNSAGFRLLTLSLALPAMFSATARAASQTWDGGAGNNVLNAAANWDGDALPTSALDTATWNGLAAGPLLLVWNGNFGPTSGNTGGVNLTVAATQTESLQLDATLGTFGLGDVTIASGAGDFTLGDGAGTAPMTIRDPSMTFTNDSSNFATIRSDVVFGNGGGGGGRNITFTGTGTWSLEGAIYPGSFGALTAATLTKSGTGTLTLAAQNFQGGTTTVTGGSILLLNGAALGTGAVTLGSGTTGKLQLANGITLANPINTNGSTGANSVAGSIENTSGDNILNSNITWNQTGGLFSNIASVSGSLTLTGTFTPAGGVTGTRTLNLTGAGSIISAATHTISDGTATLGLRKSGTGTATISGTNNYTGPTTLAGGTLSLGSPGAIATAGAIEFSGGTLQHSAANTTDYSARIAAGTSTSAVSIDTNGQNLSFATPLTASQSGGLTKIGNGTLTLTSTHAYSGTTTVKNGVLAVQNGGTLGTGDVSIEGGAGTKQLALSGGVTLAGLVNYNIAGRFSVPTDDPANAAIVSTSGANSISGKVRFAATGGTWVNLQSLAGTFTLGDVTAAVVTGSRNINFTGAGNITVSGVISNGSATVGISKGGAGTLTLSNTNTYTGDTSVRAGTLAVTNNSATTFADTSTVGISSGAVLHLPNAATDIVAALVLNGVPQANGLYDSSTPGGYITGLGKIQVGTAGYASWAGANAGGQTAELDFDKDGTSNGVEYFMNAPAGFTVNPPLVGRVVTWPNGGTIPASAYGTLFVVQTSTDLSAWTPVPSGSLTTNTDGPGGSLSYTLPTSGPKRFVRLVVAPD